MTRTLLLLLAAALLAGSAFSHEVRPARLSVAEIADGRFLVRWAVPAIQNQRLAIDPVFAGACGTNEGRAEGGSSGASIQSWRIDCSRDLAGTRIEFSNLSATMVDVLVQITFLDGREYTGLVRPDAPAFRVPVRENDLSVFRSYLVLGVEHIWFGWDHLLFVLGLMLLVTDGRRLVWAITGFSVAHSITLALATLGFVFVPGPPVEAVIALSIVMLGVEAVRYHRGGEATFAIRAPWAMSIAIGLIHGLGFAGALNNYGLPDYAEFYALLAFNLGVEAGQLVFVAALVLLGSIVRRINVRLLPLTRVTAMWLVGICGSYWLVERSVGLFSLQ